MVLPDGRSKTPVVWSRLWIKESAMITRLRDEGWNTISVWHRDKQNSFWFWNALIKGEFLSDGSYGEKRMYIAMLLIRKSCKSTGQNWMNLKYFVIEAGVLIIRFVYSFFTGIPGLRFRVTSRWRWQPAGSNAVRQWRFRVRKGSGKIWKIAAHIWGQWFIIIRDNPVAILRALRNNIKAER